MLALCVTVLLVQDPGVEPAPEKPPVAAEPAFEEWNDAQARAAVKEFKARMKGRKVSLRDKTEAVAALAKGSHRQLIAPLAEVARADSALTVRIAAAEALAHQPAKQARPVVLRLLADEAVEDAPQVLAALVSALSGLGYTERDWDAIDDLFEREFGPEHVPLQQAILRLVIAHEEKQAVDLLVRHLGEPAPVDVHSPSNPPAEYWKARYKAWEVWRGDVKEALFKITGQRFSTPEEARTWLEKNGRKIGIR